MERYVVQSLELHLLFLRIMKEHSFFLEAAFVAKDTKYIREADSYKRAFEALLSDVVRISNGLIRKNVLESQEIVTPYTFEVEKQTQFLTGISINSNITLIEQKLNSSLCYDITPNLVRQVKFINQRTLKLLNGLIYFKERILDEVLKCCLFTANYPLLIRHILREAKLYYSYIEELENSGDIECENMRETELFWNQIMMEHALFIRGLLDPTESELISTANDFANEYALLLEEARSATDATMESLTLRTIQETEKYSDFKEAGTKGLSNCEIESIILPLLADHVLREANHYLRLLKS